jgi:hypothetical protein
MYRLMNFNKSILALEEHRRCIAAVDAPFGRRTSSGRSLTMGIPPAQVRPAAASFGWSGPQQFQDFNAPAR